MLIKLENGVPVGNPVDEKNFRSLFKTTSFPKILTPESVESFGFGIFEYTKSPEPLRYMKCVEDIPRKDERGIYIQTWKTVAMSSQEIESCLEEKKNEVRSIRTGKLRSSDWIMLYDVIENSDYSGDFISAWIEYREQLRRISDQPGFPWNIKWPSEPTLTK